MDLPRKAIGVLLVGGSVAESLRKPIANCDFPGGGIRT